MEQYPPALPSPGALTFRMASSLLFGRFCSISCVSAGAPAESVYSKVQHLEGETLSVLCSYKGRKNLVEGKVWCKIRRKKCEPGFTRAWAQGPRYLLQDDVRAKVVKITMTTLRRQDSGRYWCMRNSSGTLYPLMGFLLEVSPGEQACWGSGNVGVSSLPCTLLTSAILRIILHQWTYVTVGFHSSFTDIFMGLIIPILLMRKRSTRHDMALTLSRVTELASGRDKIQTQDSLCFVLFSHQFDICLLNPYYVPGTILGSEDIVKSKNRPSPAL